ncbi:MAG TPA: DUF1127 domain-containing protein [Woeseiaceae bacterium]|nr:DUF1127 domain-containing protein [Woeseiaceae bacterium]
MNKTLSSRDHRALAIGRSASFGRQQHRSRIARAVARATKAVGGSIKSFSGGIVEGFRMSRLYEQLVDMSDRELAQIGISRADIPAVVAGTHRIAGTARSHNIDAGG